MARKTVYYGLQNNCCHECSERHVGCHGSCEKYQNQYRKNEEVKASKKAYLMEWQDYYVAVSRPSQKPR